MQSLISVYPFSIPGKFHPGTFSFSVNKYYPYVVHGHDYVIGILQGLG